MQGTHPLADCRPKVSGWHSKGTEEQRNIKFKLIHYRTRCIILKDQVEKEKLQGYQAFFAGVITSELSFNLTEFKK